MRFGLFAMALLCASCGHVSTVTEHAAPGHTAALDVSTGRPVVQALVNGQGPYPLIFDTGASTIVLLKSLARDLGATVLGQTPLGSPLGGGEPPTADIIAIERLELPGAEARQLQAVAIDDALLPLRGARGVIGPNAFGRSVIEIDVSAATMWIGAAPRQDIPRWSRLDDDDFLTAEIVVGDVAIPAHVDTGNPGVLTLPTRFADRLPLREPLQVSGGMRTIDAVRVVSLGRLDADAHVSGTPVRLGVVSFADVPVANVGMQGLRGFTVVVDMPNRRWALQGAAAGPLIARQPLGDFGARAMPEPDGAIRVFAVDAGSRAAAAGLRIDDRIVSVNGAQVAAISQDRLRESVAQPGTRLGVERNGAAFELLAP